MTERLVLSHYTQKQSCRAVKELATWKISWKHLNICRRYFDFCKLKLLPRFRSANGREWEETGPTWRRLSRWQVKGRNLATEPWWPFDWIVMNVIIDGGGVAITWLTGIQATGVVTMSRQDMQVDDLTALFVVKKKKQPGRRLPAVVMSNERFRFGMRIWTAGASSKRRPLFRHQKMTVHWPSL